MQPRQTGNPAAPHAAIIAIHGVGDPKAGDTADALARLLVAQAGYAHQGSDGWLLPVEPVHPASATAPTPGRFGYSSSFVAARLGKKRTEDGDPNHGQGDLGIQLNYHLLRGTQLPDQEQTYEARRHRLADRAGRRIDVLDLYWGDLSGLDSAVQRIVTELFTLIFHLCQLGRDTVHHTALYLEKTHPQHSFATPALARSQQLADMLLTKPVGVLNALLVLLGLWWLPLAWLFTLLQGKSWAWAAVSGGVLAVLAGIAWLAVVYRGWRGGAAQAALGASAALALFGWAAAQGAWWLPHAAAALWALALAAVFVAFMGFCEPRVPGVRSWGLWLGAAVALAMLVTAGFGIGEGARDAPGLWASMVMKAIDGVLIALQFCWAVLAGAVLTLVLSGGWLKWRCADPVVTRGIDTGRFGLFASAAMFVTVACAGWSFAIGVLTTSLKPFHYQAVLLGFQNAGAMVQRYFETSTLMFAPVLMVMAALLLGGVCVLAPSIACEFGAPQAGRDGVRLGRWLTRAGTCFAHAASKIVFFSAILFALWAVYTLGCSRGGLAGASELPQACTWVNVSEVRALSAAVLGALSFALAGGAAGLLVVGSRVFGSLGKIRLALDAALDVDRHLREFPANATPRGRIAARLYSLLIAAARAGYGRIVVSAHSQGVVIATELLRYLRDKKPELLQALPPVYLFTCGGPLRQLYASRFPALYPWTHGMLDSAHGTTGPHAASLGVVRWTNAYCTGDYIGRWFWETRGQDLLATGMTYENRAAGVRQWCLGKGAHTHYYDIRMARVATEIDSLATA